MGSRDLDRLDSVAGHEHPVVEAFEDAPGDVDDGVIVIDQEEGLDAGREGFGRGDRAVRNRVDRREVDAEGGAPSESALDADIAAVMTYKDYIDKFTKFIPDWVKIAGTPLSDSRTAAAVNTSY